MPADHLIEPIKTKPGIQRDGTQLDADQYIDGQHVRFYRGRPKKMGGRILLDSGTTEIIRNLYAVEQIDNSTDVYLGRPSTLNVTNVYNNTADPEINRTPANFIADSNNMWSFDEYTVQNASGAVLLGNDPLSVTNGSNVVTVTVASTNGLQNEQQVTIAGAADTHGITAVELNITAPITIVDGTHFSYVAGGNGTSTGTGGGNAVTYNLNLPVTYVVGVAAPNLLNINNQTQRLIYWGDKTATSIFTEISTSHQMTSGGIVTAYPYFFKYGNNGVVVATTDPGGDWSTAKTFPIASSKIVKGAVTRGGTGAPAILFWSLRSLIRATFVGGDPVFQFDTIQQGVPILAQNSVVTTENAFFWISNDQFWMYDGVVRQLDNYQNRLFFFKNLNWTYRNIIFGEYRSEYHEIWWHFPFGNATENNHAIIYQIESNSWYDTSITRSAGYVASNFPNPLTADSTAILNRFNLLATLTVNLANNPITTINASAVVTVNYPSNQTLQNGNTVTIAGSTDVGTITAVQLNIQAVIFNVDPIAHTFQYTSNGVGDGTVGGGNAVTYSIQVPNNCYGLWEEDIGTDEIIYGQELAIDSFFETNYLSWVEKFPNDDRQIRIRRIEPDFVQSQNMTLVLKMRPFAQSNPIISQTYTFIPGETTIILAKVDTVNMGRFVTLKFESNAAGGDYLMGKVLINYAPGDVRP